MKTRNNGQHRICQIQPWRHQVFWICKHFLKLYFFFYISGIHSLVICQTSEQLIAHFVRSDWFWLICTQGAYSNKCSILCFSFNTLAYKAQRKTIEQRKCKRVCSSSIEDIFLLLYSLKKKLLHFCSLVCCTISCGPLITALFHIGNNYYFCSGSWSPLWLATYMSSSICFGGCVLLTKSFLV